MLRIHLVEALSPQPPYLRVLLDTRSGVRGRPESSRRYRGYLRLGGEDYNLTGIIVVYENGEIRTFSANLTSPADSTRRGNISVTLRTHEGVRIGEGSLTMNHTHDTVVYRVLLTVDE